MNIEVSMTLARPWTSSRTWREFERRGLDCCGGQRTLGGACGLAGLDPATVVAELSEVAATSDTAEWTTMSADVLVDHLEATHHRYLWRSCPGSPRCWTRSGRCTGSGIPSSWTSPRASPRCVVILEPHLLQGGARAVPDDP